MERKIIRKWIRSVIATCIVLCMLTEVISIVYIKCIDVPPIKDVDVIIKYRLSELSDDQAVMVIYSDYPRLDGAYYVIVNKCGRFKFILEKDLEVLMREGEYDNQSMKYYDLVLQREEIPYQEKKIRLNSHFLQRAINISALEMTDSIVYCRTPDRLSYSVIYGVENRKMITYRTPYGWCDAECRTLGYMLSVMGEYQRLGEEIAVDIVSQ